MNLKNLKGSSLIFTSVYLVVYFIKIILPGFKGLEARWPDWIENLVVYQSAKSNKGYSSCLCNYCFSHYFNYYYYYYHYGFLDVEN